MIHEDFLPDLTFTFMLSLMMSLRYKADYTFFMAYGCVATSCTPKIVHFTRPTAELRLKKYY
jgi:hypothetical protein